MNFRYLEIFHKKWNDILVIGRTIERYEKCQIITNVIFGVFIVNNKMFCDILNAGLAVCI